MMMGSVGILFEWILGYLLCYAWSKITIYNTLTGATVPLSIYYSPMHYIATGAIAVLCCAIAAFFPARKATRVHPVEIIRGASGARFRWRSWGWSAAFRARSLIRLSMASICR